MFIGREYELSELEKLYKKSTFQFAIIYGRRRVGKTRIIQEFIKNKKAIFFSAIESTSRRNLDQLSKTIYSTIMPKRKTLPAFASYEDALEAVCEYASEEKIIFVIDEYPYLAASERSISSILQNMIDHHFSKTNALIILCGSSMSFMENQVLGYQSPLYGRRTGQFLIKPFDYYTSSLFVKNYLPEEKAIVFGITGGIPKYLELIDDSLTLKENIIALFLKNNAYLFEEPGNLLKQELREPAYYNAIIEAIAGGSSKLNEIATATQMDTATVSTYMKSLSSLNIVKKEVAITEEKNRKKTIYKLEDTMFAFWYKYVIPNMFLIQAGESEYLYDEKIYPTINDFMGHIFEDMCKQYLQKINLSNQLPFKLLQLGKWWGTAPKKRKEAEIDIVGINELEKKALFGECKFRNEKLGKSVLESLYNKAELFQQYEHKYYVLFSKTGFSDDICRLKDEKVMCVELENMY